MRTTRADQLIADAAWSITADTFRSPTARRDVVNVTSVIGRARPDFPGPDGLCGDLGLQPLPADYPSVGREVARAYAAWDRILKKTVSVDPGECRDPEQVVEQARVLLAKSRYVDVGVVIGGEGPCAARIEPHGRFIRVSTATHSADRSDSIQRDVLSAVSPLAVRVAHVCIAPASFRPMLRSALDRAGLGTVKVVVRRTTAPCIAGGFSVSPESVTFAGMAWEAWKEMRVRAEGHHRNG